MMKLESYSDVWELERSAVYRATLTGCECFRKPEVDLPGSSAVEFRYPVPFGMMMCVLVVSNDCDAYLVLNYLWFVKHYKVQ